MRCRPAAPLCLTARVFMLSPPSQSYSEAREKRSMLYAANPWLAMVLDYFDAVSGWLLCGLIGLHVGFTAAIANTATYFLTDLKLGYCRGAHACAHPRQPAYPRGCPGHLLLDYATCCASEGDVDEPSKGRCSTWVAWPEALGLSSVYTRWARKASAGSRPRVVHCPRAGSDESWQWAYIIYVAWAVVLALLAAFLVQRVSRLAHGSGLAELKTVLGGVMIKGFLGWSSLLVKVRRTR
jgi:chloride channel 3/4/5